MSIPPPNFNQEIRKKYRLTQCPMPYHAKLLVPPRVWQKYAAAVECAPCAGGTTSQAGAQFCTRAFAATSVGSLFRPLTFVMSCFFLWQTCCLLAVSFLIAFCTVLNSPAFFLSILPRYSDSCNLLHRLDRRFRQHAALVSSHRADGHGRHTRVPAALRGVRRGRGRARIRMRQLLRRALVRVSGGRSRGYGAAAGGETNRDSNTSF